jgi:hypothetical protein
MSRELGITTKQLPKHPEGVSTDIAGMAKCIDCTENQNNDRIVRRHFPRFEINALHSVHVDMKQDKLLGI